MEEERAEFMAGLWDDDTELLVTILPACGITQPTASSNDELSAICLMA